MSSPVIYRNDRPNIDDVDRDILLKCLEDPNAVRTMNIRPSHQDQNVLSVEEIVDILMQLAALPIPNTYSRIDGFGRDGKAISAIGTCGSILAVFSGDSSACIDIPVSFEPRVSYYI